MKKCFKCFKVFSNVDALCDHIKNDHGLCGKNEFVCMQCGFTFGDFSVFKKHLKTYKRVPLEYLQDDAELEGQFFLKLLFKLKESFSKSWSWLCGRRKFQTLSTISKNFHLFMKTKKISY